MTAQEKELINFCKFISNSFGSPCDYPRFDEAMLEYCNGKCRSSGEPENNYKCWLKVYKMINNK